MPFLYSMCTQVQYYSSFNYILVEVLYTSFVVLGNNILYGYMCTFDIACSESFMASNAFGL